jgi:threonine dehydrogenase-like Zn-dependent dehydrogenase
LLQAPTDAIVRIVRTCICGSDLHPYHTMPASGHGTQMGHEFLGVVEDLGAEVTGVKEGDLVVASFAFQDNTCDSCREGVQTSCRDGGFFSRAQAELIRVPQASGTLVRLPVGEQSPLLPSLLTLADVYGTGFHAANRANVNPRTTVTVIGGGAVGLLAVLSARQLGAEQIILMGRHKARTDLGREFGATDVVAERGEQGIAKVRALTAGDGTHAVLEAVGYKEAYEQALGVVRAGGVISRVGVPQYDEAPIGFGSLFRPNLSLTGVPPRSVPTSISCCRTCSPARSIPATFSTAPSVSTRCPTDTARWTAARPSRSWCVRDPTRPSFTRRTGGPHTRLDA